MPSSWRAYSFRVSSRLIGVRGRAASAHSPTVAVVVNAPDISRLA